MPLFDDIHHTVLIVSSGDRPDLSLKEVLPSSVNMTVEIKRSAAVARRAVLEKDYDLVIINAPLSDENGVEMALDISWKCNSSILLLVPEDQKDEVSAAVSDRGIIVMPVNAALKQFKICIRYLIAFSNRIRLLEERIRNEKDKTEQLRVIDRAKFLLMEQRGLSESEAHRVIGKIAMDNGIKRDKAALRIIDELE